MATIITRAFERWQAADLVTPGEIQLDEFILANVPGLDADAAIDRDAGLPDTAHIVYREPVNAAGVVNKNTVAYSFTIGTNIGDFAFNWIGLICKKTGLLAMVTTIPTLQKVKTTATEQGNAFTRSFLIEFTGASEKTGITTPAETWQIDFTARLIGIDEYQRLLNIDHYGSALFFDDGWLIQRDGAKYRCVAGLGYVAGLRLAHEATEEITVASKPAAVWLDTVWQGSVMAPCIPVTEICVTTAGDLAEYTDEAGKKHYVFKIAEIAADGTVTDLRPVRSSDDLDKRYLRRSQNLADLDDKGKSRVNLGLGGAAVRNVGQLAGQVAAADDPRIVHAVQDTRQINSKSLTGDISLTYSDVGAVPTSRKVNNKVLTGDITLTYSDVGAVPTSRKVNNKALTGDITLTYTDVGAVPAGRKVNGRALSADINVTAQDIFNGQAVGLGANQNLNSYTTPGIYYQPANANTSAALNYPENNAGALIVYRDAGIQQEYRVYNSSRRWTRAQYADGAWTPWAREYNTQNKPTYSDVGAVPTSRKVNNKALTGDITLTYSDVGAAAASHKHPWSDITGVPDFITVANADARYFGNFAMFTANGTFTVPAGVKKVMVEMIGGGAGGCAAPSSTNYYKPAPGGRAAQVASAIVTVSPGTAISVSVGAGGAGAIPAAGTALIAGGEGGSSSFGGVSAAGGKGLLNSGVWDPAEFNGLKSTVWVGGDGENSPFGSGGKGVTSSFSHATGYGAGGSGGSCNGVSKSNGGNGSPGFVRIWW
ncbi:phage tail-collar fiber domain-containing protein [Escherichia coli]|uniref:phage tail-collar fiber domain-containing protein n=1 Tax=Escherichia coli TaxID=562 RepID=UPI000BE5D2D0|nr:phage tail protein [Escherichia coli]MCX0808191.1 phage tail protein [Escherichia coli]